MIDEKKDPITGHEQAENEARMPREPRVISGEGAPAGALTSEDNLFNPIENNPINDPISNQFIESLNIPKNTVAKLTLSIRRQQEKFLYDAMEKMNQEQKLEFISNHLTSLQEITYAFRERQLASSKVKDLVLQEIDKLNLIDVNKFRQTGEIEPSTNQKKELTKFEKEAKKYLSFNMKPLAVLNILKKLGCNEETGKRILGLE